MSEIRQSTAGGGGGEEGNQLSRGHCAGPSRVSASGVLGVCAQKPHTRERARARGGYLTGSLIERAPSGSLQVGDSS